jgi:hypothetical protein
MPFPIIVRARPPAGRARPSPLHIKKALASKWYHTISCERTKQIIRRRRREKKGGLLAALQAERLRRGQEGTFVDEISHAFAAFPGAFHF